MGIKANEFAATVEKAYKESWGYIWATTGESWTEAKQRNLESRYNSNPAKYADYRQSCEYGSKWIGHEVADCSGLIKWALNKLGLKGIYHGSNSQFSRNCIKTGKIEKGTKIPIGALIFTGDESSHNHVGVLTSEKTVTEANGAVKGVIHTSLSNKKWTYWGLVRGIDYSVEPEKAPIPDEVMIPVYAEITLPTLRKGAKGEAVVTLQKMLMNAGESLPKYGADGDFGSETLKAVKNYQQKNGLVVDGIVGPKTWNSLIDIEEAE